MVPHYALPFNRFEWSKEARKQRVEATSINELNFQSGSKLALRMIWKTKRANDFNLKRWGLDAADARRLLENIPDWVAYTTKAQSCMGATLSFGRYDLLLVFQKADRLHKKSERWPE